jgi:hypothetical protein
MSLRGDFKRNPMLVDGVRAFLASETFAEAKKVLEAEGPLRKRDPAISADRMLGRIEGYDDYASNLASLATHAPQGNLINQEVVDTDQEKENARE